MSFYILKVPIEEQKNIADYLGSYWGFFLSLFSALIGSRSSSLHSNSYFIFCISNVPKNGVNTIFYYYVMSIYTEQFELYSAGTTFKEIYLYILIHTLFCSLPNS